MASQNVIITGAASGVGLESARRLGANGHGIVLVDVREDALSKASETLSSEGVSVVGVVAGDVSDPATATAAVETATASGGLFGLVNSAAIVTVGTLPDLEIEQWDRIFAVNVRGTFLMMKAVIPELLKQGAGVIVNIASVDGLVSEPNLVSYCSTKGAVVQLTRGAAVDHARAGLRINAVCPGAIDTPFFRGVVDPLPNSEALVAAVANRHPFGRMLQPADVAAAVEFLFQPQAAAIVGSCLVVDGGLIATWGSVSQ